MSSLPASDAAAAAERLQWKSERRAALLVVATLFATASFQAALAPPAGVWSTDLADGSFKLAADLSSDSENIQAPPAAPLIRTEAGTAVMGRNHPRQYFNFKILNCLVFFLSIATICFILLGFSFKYATSAISVALQISCLFISTNFINANEYLTPRYDTPGSPKSPSTIGTSIQVIFSVAAVVAANVAYIFWKTIWAWMKQYMRALQARVQTLLA